MSEHDPGAETPAAVPAPPAVRRARGAVVGRVLALLRLCLAWELWLARTRRGTLALKALPLALSLPGLLRHRLYTFRWLSLLVWLYATEGLVRGPSDRGLSAWLAWDDVALAGALFVACVHYIQLRVPRRPKTSSTAKNTT